MHLHQTQKHKQMRTAAHTVKKMAFYHHYQTQMQMCPWKSHPKKISMSPSVKMVWPRYLFVLRLGPNTYEDITGDP